MAAQIPAGLGQAQRERLAYIDFRLYFLGEVSRADIASRFGVAPAGAIRDRTLYGVECASLAPGYVPPRDRG